MVSKRDVLASIAHEGEAYDPMAELSRRMEVEPLSLRPGQIRDLADPTGGSGGMSRQMLSQIIRGAGASGMKAEAPLAHGRISQRFPTSKKKGGEDPLKENLLINTDVLKSEPGKAEQAADIVKTYPGMPREAQEMNPAEVLSTFTGHAKDNLLHLWDMMPPAARERASQWYLGANKIANERAAETGVHPNAAAGTYAALSPQKDWFQNVYLGDQVLRTLARDPKLGKDVLSMAEANPDNFGDVMPMLTALQGRKLSTMDPDEAAVALRAYNQTTDPRRYNIITPEGDYGPLKTTGSGDPSTAAWGTYGDISKAISAARSGGDTAKLSPMMGFKHKVRNFYNSIVAPEAGQEFGDITADTHQIAASLLRPLGGSSPEVAQGLQSGSKGVAAPPVSATTGLRGLYPLYADATRGAAAERGVPVRAMQSVPWEAVRSLFSPASKRGNMPGTIEQIWQAAGRGEISAQEARRRIVEAAGGFTPPTW